MLFGTLTQGGTVSTSCTVSTSPPYLITLQLATTDTNISGFNSAEWRDAKEFVEALSPSLDATVISGAEKYPLLSC